MSDITFVQSAALQSCYHAMRDGVSVGLLQSLPDGRWRSVVYRTTDDDLEASFLHREAAEQFVTANAQMERAS